MTATHFARTVTYVDQVLARCDPTTLELVLDRLHDARRGFPTGAEPRSEVADEDADGNPTAAPMRYSDRTGTLAADAADAALLGRRRDRAEADLGTLARALVDLRDTATALAAHTPTPAPPVRAPGRRDVDLAAAIVRHAAHVLATLGDPGRELDPAHVPDDLLDRLYRAAHRIAHVLDTYGRPATLRSCVECRKAGTVRPVDVGRYGDRCRWHGDARARNGGRDTPVALTRAHLAGQDLSDALIARHPHPDGSSWKRPKPRTRKAAA